MWILYALLCTIALSVSVIFAKCGSRKADATVTTALRTLTVTVCAWILLFSENKTGLISTANGTEWLYIIFTGIALTVSLICYHVSLKSGSATSVSVIMRTTPFLIILISVINHSFKSVIIPIICVVLIGLGILFSCSRSKRSGGKWIIFGLLSSIAAVSSYIINATGVSLNSMAVEWTLILSVSLLVSLIAIFIRGLHHGIGRIPFAEIIFTVLSGIAAFLAFFLFRYAYFEGNREITTAILSLSICSTAGLSALLLKERISWKTICGLLLIIVGMLLFEFTI